MLRKVSSALLWLRRTPEVALRRLKIMIAATTVRLRTKRMVHPGTRLTTSFARASCTVIRKNAVREMPAAARSGVEDLAMRRSDIFWAFLLNGRARPCLSDRRAPAQALKTANSGPGRCRASDQDFTAKTWISMRNRGSASRASTQARAGAWPGVTQASHTAFMASKSVTWASQT